MMTMGAGNPMAVLSNPESNIAIRIIRKLLGDQYETEMMRMIRLQKQAAEAIYQKYKALRDTIRPLREALTDLNVVLEVAPDAALIQPEASLKKLTKAQLVEYALTVQRAYQEAIDTHHHAVTIVEDALLEVER